ncbi:SDR family oxidoreductase [Mucilaginibacter ginsenosidivorans]|uniref:SDR family oxidoreductase n=1 Tax=Mucilaginibacter ginsenosidivorans TaxID=398053 RepID=A0A5B8V579_9SPHI|nr:SDR family oxidoreductase [Mucilaginibacter ginsenosidivorans]
MSLHNKNAVIYGAGGSLGGAVAKAFAAAGARVYLTGLHLEKVQKVAAEIQASGGYGVADEVDALDEQAVAAHIAKVAEQAGTVDISFNTAWNGVVQGVPLTEISVSDFITPVNMALQSRFITAVAAVKVMMQQRSGVILNLTATPGGTGYPYTGGFAPTCAAIESLSRNLAAEFGAYGIRSVNIRSAGSPDSKVFADTIAAKPELMRSILSTMEADTMLKKLPGMADIANTAVFLVSDLARMITGVTIDVTCGTTEGINYRVGMPSFNEVQ